MLPAGPSADLLDPADGAVLRRWFPRAQTVAALLVGSCSCDLFAPRDPAGRTEERELRAAWRRLGLSREAMLAALDRHRRPPPEPPPPAGWPAVLAAFVVEHARNAGPSLYFHHVAPWGLAAHPPRDPRIAVVTPTEVLRAPGSWLAEERLTRVEAA